MTETRVQEAVTADYQHLYQAPRQRKRWPLAKWRDLTTLVFLLVLTVNLLAFDALTLNYVLKAHG